MGDEPVTTLDETVSMSKAEYEKSLQSAEDRLRTKYSKQIKELESKVTELTPVVKSDTEVELEKQLKMIEQKQMEVEAKERYLNLQTTLQAKNIDQSIAGFLKQDVDLEAFETILTNLVADKVKSTGVSLYRECEIFAH